MGKTLRRHRSRLLRQMCCVSDVSLVLLVSLAAIIVLVVLQGPSPFFSARTVRRCVLESKAEETQMKFDLCDASKYGELDALMCLVDEGKLKPVLEQSVRPGGSRDGV